LRPEILWFLIKLLGYSRSQFLFVGLSWSQFQLVGTTLVAIVLRGTLQMGPYPASNVLKMSSASLREGPSIGEFWWGFWGAYI
jgi:hypothetical protein